MRERKREICGEESDKERGRERECVCVFAAE